jgi:hypothetical protein
LPGEGAAPARGLAAPAGRGQSGSGALSDELSLEFREGGEEVEGEPAGGAGRVEGLAQGAQAHVALGEGRDDGDEVAERAAEAVEPPYDDDVARPGVVEQVLAGG